MLFVYILCDIMVQCNMSTGGYVALGPHVLYNMFLSCYCNQARAPLLKETSTLCPLYSYLYCVVYSTIL